MLVKAVLPRRKLDLLSVSVFVGLALWASLVICSLLTKNPSIDAIRVFAAKIAFGVNIFILTLLPKSLMYYVFVSIYE